MNCIFPVFFYGLSSRNSSSSSEASIIVIVLSAIILTILGVGLLFGDKDELVINVRTHNEGHAVFAGDTVFVNGNATVVTLDDGTVVLVDDDGNVVTVDNGTVVPVEE